MSTGATPEGSRSDIAGKLTQHQYLSGSATIGNRIRTSGNAQQGNEEEEEEEEARQQVRD
ncbi:hypothetical protein CGRA01v4_00088 [Colletotrichum graminicola]|uniref:Uncharacterized protein n=1 Tax=Colletotrichum graminicola (strain M1.001 / M2 / FGSC 10212) TaxID=645133 RepID=E3QUE1_COLGM|nr:uncharacterized protein GLRG_09623 [Colletotrichum graminicola M1.001]EFQ34479.1 hypothetical protein GLRG_09623 [Colletotrichum graminicola M1.001]WDK08810.1 hypothetical protein CGRA01v4_00088 [Colletotrichum graminicola]